ncbi:peptide antibiotic transporter SbmA [Aliamphritea hakodatensis]|uniref:peptide antibiotic transporter SbmA n=1 Tax=Aliamphritea hakodatensis TaxID=2895352 RepID=UPI0022FD5DCA|nr:peptide antibiotic transporter SbmA [Aliamphritea hakodatensis]
MFNSFFPNPKMFFLSVVLFSGVSCGIWYGFNDQMALLVGLDIADEQPVIGLGHFVTDSFLLFYGYYFLCTALFSLFWFKYANHKWQWWSIVGSSAILFSTYFSVQVSVAINNWRRPFFDLVQTALKPIDPEGGDAAAAAVTDEKVSSVSSELFDLIVIFSEIAFLAIFVFVVTRFFVSHFIFRWRTAMNDYYTARWEQVRHIEGASQRIQEDTMRFASIMEGLGVSIIDSVMTLFAFLPVLWVLSDYVSELPVVGEIAHPLFYAALVWAIFGTGLLALVGIKLPGLEFKNQRVEAAFRKELVYGEDDEARAEPVTLRELFANVRKNYFRLYFHYMYFNVARMMYLQADNIFVFVLLVPTIAVGAITFGVLQQILTAFGQVSNSFQYLVNSWTTIVELLSVYKRLASFEAVIHHQPLPEIDSEAVAEPGAAQ